MDNYGLNGKAWNNRYRPTGYVVDGRGCVRHGWVGEPSYNGATDEETVRKLVDALLLDVP